MTKRKIYAALGIAVLLATATWFATTDAQAASFGTNCQADYENDWLHELPYSWDRCDGFNDELDETDIFRFYFSLENTRRYYSTCDHCDDGGADTVTLLFTNTHGSTRSQDARLAMWNSGVRAKSVEDDWRLGNERTGLSIMANWACDTLRAKDSWVKMRNRWRNTFRGGMRIALGSWDTLYDGPTTVQNGENFANNLQSGDSIKWAWFDGIGDGATDQDVKVLVTGSGESNCETRKNTMKWQNHHTFRRLRDGDVNWFCSDYIENY